MKVRLVVAVLTLLATTASQAADSKPPGRAIVESAWADGVAAADGNAPCPVSIGKRKAQVLARYCVENATSLHAPCHLTNQCKVLAETIWGACKQSGWDALVAAEKGPVATHLPCGNIPNAKDWLRLSAVR